MGFYRSNLHVGRFLPSVVIQQPPLGMVILFPKRDLRLVARFADATFEASESKSMFNV
jgi:hypothetical protein